MAGKGAMTEDREASLQGRPARSPGSVGSVVNEGMLVESAAKDQIWHRFEQVAGRVLAGTCVLRHLGTKETIVLQGTATLVWVALEVPGTLDELLEDLLEAVPGCLAIEVVANVETLVDMGFVVV